MNLTHSFMLHQLLLSHQVFQVLGKTGIFLTASQSNDQGSSRVEAMLEKVLAKQTKSEKMLSGLTEIVAIQKLESQMRDTSREQYPPKKGRLPSDTIQHPKNGGGGIDCVYAISTRSEEEVQFDAPIINDELPSKEKVADILESSKVADDKSKQAVKGALRPLTHLFKSKPLFPQRLVKKKEDTKFEKFYDQLKQLSLNFPFLDAIKDMPSFSKYLKDLMTKKKLVQHETGDLGAFTISCSVGYHNFARALCDNEASINLMPLAIYKQSSLGMPRPSTMRSQIANRSIKRPVEVEDDVLIRVGKFMLPADFVILDYAVNRDIPIILGRPFLATGRALMDSEKNEVKFRVNDEEVIFQASKGMKLPSAYESISVIDSFDVVDEAVEFKMEEKSLGVALAAILVYFDAEHMESYVDM
ncbi:uncharacterized protein LOC132043348, partial [Lycium ferocissimum]|uniref:uncharacterized protein LOC132043348 n=1 Tax=Lycium ferocissimum TaxID=112874 RepID=UPI0028156B79